MGRRIPLNLTPAQTEVVLLVAATLLAVAIALAVFELLLTRGAGLVVRLTGRTPPRKSPTRIAIDELEERVRRRRSE